MGGPMMHGRDLRKLGGEIAEALDASRDERVIARARARLAEDGGRAPASPLRFAIGGLALAGAAAAAFLMFGRGSIRGSAFAVGGPPRQGSVGAAIEGGAGAPTPIVFHDGSRFVVEPGGRARVTVLPAPCGRGDAGCQGATGELVLESGAVRGWASRGADAPSWRVAAGPFQVLARASDFSVTWDAAHEAITVRVEAGAPVTVKDAARSSAVEPGAELRLGKATPAP